MFYLAGVGLAFFLNLLLLSKKNKSLADRVLALWLFVIMLHLALFTFMRMKWYPELLGIDLPLPVMHGPLLFLYTIALTQNQIPIRTWLLHLAVPLSFYIYLIPFIFLPVDQKIYIYNNQGIGYEIFLLVRGLCIPVSGVLYVVLSTLALRKHRRSIVQEFSSIEKINLLWLQYLIVWIAAIWAIVMTGNDDWIFGATVIFIFFIGFFGIRQAGIFHTTITEADQGHVEANVVSNEAVADESLPVNAETAKTKYQKSGLSADVSESLHRQLISLMESDKPFRESELSLTDLAERLDTQPNYLSQVINEREGKNFYDYINTLRVQEFIRTAPTADSRKLTLFAIAQQCGFNSKSSFNRYFKKVTGQLPSEFVQVAVESEN